MFKLDRKYSTDEILSLIDFYNGHPEIFLRPVGYLQSAAITNEPTLLITEKAVPFQTENGHPSIPILKECLRLMVSCSRLFRDKLGVAKKTLLGEIYQVKRDPPEYRILNSFGQSCSESAKYLRRKFPEWGFLFDRLEIEYAADAMVDKWVSLLEAQQGNLYAEAIFCGKPFGSLAGVTVSDESKMQKPFKESFPNGSVSVLVLLPEEYFSTRSSFGFEALNVRYFEEKFNLQHPGQKISWTIKIVGDTAHQLYLCGDFCSQRCLPMEVETNGVFLLTINVFKGANNTVYFYSYGPVKVQGKKYFILDEAAAKDSNETVVEGYVDIVCPPELSCYDVESRNFLNLQSALHHNFGPKKTRSGVL